MAIDFSNYVRVTNHHPNAITATFNGEEHTFNPNEPEDVTLEVARHVFGFGVNDKEELKRVYHRHGLGMHSTTTVEQDEWRKKIQFGPVTLPPAKPISDDNHLLAADGDASDGGHAPSEEDSPESEEALPTVRKRK